MIKKYVLLDRDGVINHDSDNYIKSTDEWHAIDRSLEAIELLNRHGFNIVVISNQSGLARGLFDEATLSDIHAKMHTYVNKKGGVIEEIYFCPHHPKDICECRKPKPGLLKKFAQEKKVDLKNTIFIGDSLRDIEAAQSVGAKPILVKTGNGEKTLREHPQLSNIICVFDDLYEAASYLIS
jgi:D-glycero-D-manno-heptose 1,7-bisphosphate phosphatase